MLLLRPISPDSRGGPGWNGLWVALFVYSKFAELVDTVLLLLAGRIWQLLVVVKRRYAYH